MKRVLIIVFFAVFATTGFATNLIPYGTETMIPQAGPKKVYYVVLGSFNSLQDAKKFNYNTPDGLECNIYRVKVGRKTVYRACCNVFKTSKEAHETARQIQKYYSINAWVWPSNGLATCVYHETGLNGEPLPLSPR